MLLVGGHVAALPERTLREEDADFVAAGEGLHTLVGLVEALKTPAPDFGAGARPLVAATTAGRVTRRTGRWSPTSTREMPALAWDLLPMGTYRAHNWHCLDGRDRQPYAALYTTLGCPYHCSFCCIQAPFRAASEAGGLQDIGQQLPLLEPRRRDRRRSTCWSAATACATSRSPTRCSC